VLVCTPEVRKDAPSDIEGKQRRHCIADQLSSLRKVTDEGEIVGKRLEPSALAQGEVAVLQRMEELRAGAARNGLGRLVRPQPEHTGGSTAAPFRGRAIHDAAEGATPITVVP
jgi:hypothetical protein